MSRSRTIPIPRADGGPDAYRCGNCERVWTFAQLDAIADLEERIDPGGPMPAGECPDPDETCGGALCYPVVDVAPFTVVASYTGDCCDHSHIWARSVRARTADRAALAMRKRLTREGHYPEDLVVLAGAPEVLLVEEGER